MTAGRTNINQTSQSWCTPPKYVKAILTFFDNKINLDPCSNIHSLIKADKCFMLPKNDGLNEEWNFKNIFVNPPYGADRNSKTTIKDWIRKCLISHKQYNSEVLALIPVAPNTRHWKDYIFGKAAAICFLYDTRLRFYIDGHKDEKGAPMACAMVYWGNSPEKFINIFSEFGAALDTSKSIGKKFGGAAQLSLI